MSTDSPSPEGCLHCGVTKDSEPCRRLLWRKDRAGFIEIWGSEPLKRWHAGRPKRLKKEETDGK